MTHFGGLWEAAVKRAKTLLRKTIETATWTHEILETVLVEIESILNSKPLTPFFSNHSDLVALTSGHFLPLADPDTHPRKANLSHDWHQIKKIKHAFWQRWSKEYLHLFQHRYNWKAAMPNIPADTYHGVAARSSYTCKQGQQWLRASC